MALQLRRGTDAERVNVTFAEGELIYTTDNQKLWVGDGITEGGIAVISEDSPSSLTRNLDLNEYSITGTGSISVQGYIQFGSYSTEARDLLVSQNGMVIYNTTDNRFQGYQNGVWINLDDGSAA